MLQEGQSILKNMITFKAKGSYKKAESFLEKLSETVHLGELDKYGRKGVEALSNATPKDTGLTASSWEYSIERPKPGVTKIVWSNTNVQNGWANVAILIQYGHAAANGTYVEGIDYINPAIQPIFDEIADSIWKEVKGLK